MSKPDPLIAASLKKIPGAEASREQRVAWLRMCAMAMDSAYGVQGPIPIDVIMPSDASPSAFEKALAEARAAGPLTLGELADKPAAAPAPDAPPKIVRVAPVPRFFIDHLGNARRNFLYGPEGAGIQLLDQPVMVNASELEGETLFDDRGEGDLATIQWADGSRGVLGKRVNIAATPDMLAKAG